MNDCSQGRVVFLGKICFCGANRFLPIKLQLNILYVVVLKPWILEESVTCTLSPRRRYSIIWRQIWQKTWLHKPESDPLSPPQQIPKKEGLHMANVWRVWITKTTIYPESQEFLSSAGWTCSCGQKTVTYNIWNTSIWFLQQSWLDNYLWLAQEHYQLLRSNKRLCQTRWPRIIHSVWQSFSFSSHPRQIILQRQVTKPSCKECVL